MSLTALRRTARGIRARIIYRLDTLLTYPPIGQLLALVLLTFLLVIAWAAALRFAVPHAPEASSDREAMWWSLTHLMDGGTMASDGLGHRLVALGATASGVIVVSLVTAAFASKMNERIQDLRSGLNPVVERGHVLVLGFSADVVLIAGEIARSGQWRTLVVLAQADKDRIEIALRTVTHASGSRLRVVVRTGDPRSEAALLRVAAERARSIVVIPPPELDDEESVQWTLSTLLAVRRVVEEEFTGDIIVEARHADARDVLQLAAEPGVAGPRALSTEIVASDDITSRVLAQSARQEGVYFALREILSFNEHEMYIEDVPEPLRGLTFDDAHAKVTSAVLVGVIRPSDGVCLAPAKDRAITLADGDRLVMLAAGPNRFRLDGSLPDAVLAVPTVTARAKPERVVVLGFNRILPLVVRELDEILPDGSEVVVVCGDPTPTTAPVRAAARAEASRTKVSFDDRTPCGMMRATENDVHEADAVIILGCEESASDNGDADALANLLWLRHGMRRTGRTIRRVVTQVRDPRSALHVPEMAHDFLVSSSVVAMLVAQAALDSDVARVYRELLSPTGAEIVLRPRREYLGAGAKTFADAMAVARVRGEIAIGFMTSAPESAVDREGRRERIAAGEPEQPGSSSVVLNPARNVAIADDAGTFVIAIEMGSATRPSRIPQAKASPPADGP